jgi:cell division protein ZapE
VASRNRRLVESVEAAAARDGFSLDSAQHELLDRLAILGADLGISFVRRSSPRSLYIHGDAGRGKSWLANTFYQALPLAQKTRVHFHGFFDELHRGIHEHRVERDAVERAIDDVAGDSRLLFFDELHVHDSGDARLLTRLLDHVFQRGLTVLATSNYAPDALLPNPIWHHTFESGIALIKARMDVWELAGAVDYRAVNERHEHGFAAGTWTVAPPSGASDCHIVTVGGRAFAVTSASDGELAATFDQMCAAARSTVEYLHWARTFSRWTITDIPPLEAVDPEAQQRFINLVDVLVDADVQTHFRSTVDLAGFIASSSNRPDAFRMTSRLRLLPAPPR